MLKVRLQRVGRKNDPSFRVVVTDSKNGPKSGKFIEVLGSYDARKGEPILKEERIKYWLSVGAKTSGTLHNLLISRKMIEGKKINVLPKHRPIKKEEVIAEPAVASVTATQITTDAETVAEVSQLVETEALAPELVEKPVTVTAPDLAEPVVLVESPSEEKVSPAVEVNK